MPLATAPDLLLAKGRKRSHFARDIELWAHDNTFVVSYKHETVDIHCKTGTGIIRAVTVRPRPPMDEGCLQAIVRRSFLLGRPLNVHEYLDVVRPYALAAVLTA